MPIQRIKTKFLRGLDDNMQIQINGRVGLVEGKVNFNDWMDNRPGGAVRIKSADAIAPIKQGLPDIAGAMQLLQYVDAMSQERTGITKYSQGLDADTLNHTADGIKRITARADLRVKMIARKFAETGVTDLFRLIQKGRLLNVLFFNASATYTPTAGTGGALVFGWAAGGGGGGTGTGPSGTGNSQNIAPAGNSGAGAIWWWPNPTQQWVAVGAGGAAGTPSVSGGQGGNSAIGSLLVIPGGRGGVSTGTVGNAASNSATVQGDMPSATVGTLLFQRVTEMGDHGIFALAPYNPRGGAGMFSGRPPFAMSPGSGWGAGFGPGMGGDGAFCNNYGQQSNGSAGANGQFIIFEFA